MVRRIPYLLLAVVCLIGASVCSAQIYTITDLGALHPKSINTWGQVVGDYGGQAFLWTHPGKKGLRAIGLLPGGTFSTAVSINDFGMVTGTADGQGTVFSPFPEYPNRQCDNLIQPFVWTLKDGIRGVGTLGSGVFAFPNTPPDEFWCLQDSYSSGINVRGQGIGYTGNELLAYNLYQWGLSWDSSGHITYFGGSWPPTFANGISNTGQIVGQNSNHYFFGIGDATSWKGGVAIQLATLGGVGTINYDSSANDVNDLGQIVGWSSTTSLDTAPPSSWPNMHAVLWTADGTIRDLGTLPGDMLSAATKINLYGQVIGSSGNTAGTDTNAAGPAQYLRRVVNGRPFIWSEKNGMQDLNELIPPSGWVLTSASDINVWGQIVGVGIKQGEQRGFILTPRGSLHY